MTKPAPLATRLAAVLRDAGVGEGEHLTEEWVAERLGVSRTPARRAMAALAERGVLVREANRGFFLRRAGAELTRIAGEDAGDEVEAAYLALARDHLGGAFGGEFTASDLGRRYGLNPRQGQRLLSRMEGEGLVRRRPARGWVFEPVLTTAGAHDQSYRFRMIVEPAALLEPGFAVDAGELAAHRARQEALAAGGAGALTPAELFETNAAFHETLVGGSGNSFLLDAVRRQNRLRRLIEYRLQGDVARLVEQAREHLALLDLVERGRLAEAADFLRDHLDRVRRRKIDG
ncbi:GntR family transcriptional regulator [Streptomyces millisiae]|uniref:GntR family transcriptional regulator n=1 Tax=Streptomyces millisiae TaxID=3075542 RepID=A0ABU2LM28_9ACTN|nr:GntR family transcriptional regulator [Streptomyces sp. DSM 44918]MDT0318639.1 GntR family transcriptional regulator [Streptomyces sp. DSM 44918]